MRSATSSTTSVAPHMRDKVIRAVLGDSRFEIHGYEQEVDEWAFDIHSDKQDWGFTFKDTDTPSTTLESCIQSNEMQSSDVADDSISDAIAAFYTHNEEAGSDDILQSLFEE